VSKGVKMEFRLSMPGVSSWNGRWSGEDRNYTIVRSLDAADLAVIGDRRSWSYAFGDGWVARVDARELQPRERPKKSDGFCGYDWMVSNILRWNTASCQHEFRLLERHTYGEGDWERCRYCSEARSIRPVAAT
jgi:hypothetical protein